MRQDVQLCTNILIMRRFAWTWDQMQRDKKQLSPKDWEFLEWADGLQDQGDGVNSAVTVI